MRDGWGLVAVVATLASGCGEGQPAGLDARKFDATPVYDCDELLDEWFGLVAAGKGCTDPGECTVIDSPPFCDVGTFWGTCGEAVSSIAFDSARAAQLEADSTAGECQHPQTTDCGVGPDADCVQGTCTIVDETSCWPFPEPVHGAISIAESAVTNDLSSLGIGVMSGASVGVDYRNRFSSSVPPSYGEAFVGAGGCNVYIYADPFDALDPVDEGDVTVGPLPVCRFHSALNRYACFAREPGTSLPAGATADFDPNTSLTTLTIPGEMFLTDAVAGMYVDLTGFSHAANTGLLPIVGVISETQLQVFSAPAVLCIAAGTCAEGDLDETASASGGSYSVEAGAGPIPGGFDFLVSAEPVAIDKNAGTFTSALTVSVVPSGEGLSLAADSAMPHAMPASADADVVFRCDDCGSASELVLGWEIEGTTTDADTAGLPPGVMPPPVSARAVFRCRVIGSGSISIPADAWAIVLGTNPTRVETHVSRITGAFLDTTIITVGHGFIGYTDL